MLVCVVSLSQMLYVKCLCVLSRYLRCYMLNVGVLVVPSSQPGSRDLDYSLCYGHVPETKSVFIPIFRYRSYAYVTYAYVTRVTQSFLFLYKETRNARDLGIRSNSKYWNVRSVDFHTIKNDIVQASLCIFPHNVLYFYSFFLHFLAFSCILHFLAFFLHFSCIFLAFFLHFSCIFLAFFLHFSCIFLAFFLQFSCIFLASLLNTFSHLLTYLMGNLGPTVQSLKVNGELLKDPHF